MKQTEHLKAIYGVNFFIFKGRLFWYYNRVLETTTDGTKQNLIIKTLGSSSKIYELIETVFDKSHQGIPVYIPNTSYSNMDWNKAGYQDKPLTSIYCDQKKTILNQIDNFLNSKDWYINRHIDYKLTLLFTGEPGTGKTSLIKAIASELKRPLYTLSLRSMSGTQLTQAFISIPKGSLLCIEDIDCDNADSLTRNNDKIIAPTGPSLSTLLNLLDGVIKLDDIIIILTSNDPSKIDAALKRKGRTDYIVEITKNVSRNGI
jgi:chaperone BCS1